MKNIKFISLINILLILIFLQTNVYAGIALMSGNGNYRKNLEDFQTRTITMLKDIIQQVGDSKEVHRKIEVIRKELNELAIQAGKTKDDELIEVQTKVEDIVKTGIEEAIRRYEAMDKEYFNVIAQTIRELKKFEVPQPVGADVYVGCEVIGRRKVNSQ